LERIILTFQKTPNKSARWGREKAGKPSAVTIVEERKKLEGDIGNYLFY